jgi:hypothetical protein
MSLPLATHGYIGGGTTTTIIPFIPSLHPDVETQDLAPTVFETHTQGDPTNPGAPITIVETITDLKPTIRKPRQ